MGRKALLIGTIACLAATADASAAQRFAAPGATATGPCSQAAPCRLDAAFGQARAGDEVVVAPGDYAVANTLEAKAGVDVHGVAGVARPRLIGDARFAKRVVQLDSGTIRHLAIFADGNGPEADALQLRAGLGEDLVLGAADGDGAEVDGSPAGTVLRDSVATTAGGTTAAAGLELHGAKASVHLVNVTVLATSGQASAVDCGVTGAPVTIVNSYLRGARADVDASASGTSCSATASDFRPALSPGLAEGAGDLTGDAVFADAAGGDLRTLAGSPTIDAGVDDPLLGGSDAAGCPRVLGAAPDIGAFEHTDPLGSCGFAMTLPPPPVTRDPGAAPGGGSSSHPTGSQDAAPAAPAPHMGTSVVVSTGRGTIRVRVPHARRYRTLDGAARVPVGSTVDATHGRVRLVSAIDAHGTPQTGTFWGTRFQVRQGRHDRGMTTLKLVSATGCAPRARTAVASEARHRRRHRRSLWAHDHHGRFRTRGSSSVATARGTAWLTQERCTGTYTRVTKGAVAVRDRARGRTVVVRAGHSYLARRRRG